MDYSTLLPQIRSLHSQVPKSRILLVLIKTLFASNRNSLAYIYLTRLLWEYIAEALPPALLRIEEPWKEDPRLVKWNKRIVSQELACAILDYHTITCGVEDKRIERVLTLGANHWQLGYVFLRQMPHLQYILADSPAALDVAQSHFARIFPDRRIFNYRTFTQFESIREDFEKSNICFVDPSQLILLPPCSIDLGVTIDVLDKLDRKEADNYFVELDRLIRGYFYFKEEKYSALREADYHLPDDWEEIFWRTCPLYPHSFEALFVQSTSE